MRIQLNIGLNVKDEAPSSPLRITRLLITKYNLDVKLANVVVGEYDGVKELTLYIKAITKDKLSNLIKSIEELCIEFKQECIALKCDVGSILIYNPTFEGAKIRFNNKYFKTK